MKALDVVKVGRSDRWLGYGERADAKFPDRIYLAIYKGPSRMKATDGIGVSRLPLEFRSMLFGALALLPVAPTMERLVCVATMQLTMARPARSRWQSDRSRLPSGMRCIKQLRALLGSRFARSSPKPPCAVCPGRIGHATSSIITAKGNTEMRLRRFLALLSSRHDRQNYI